MLLIRTLTCESLVAAGVVSFIPSPLPCSLPPSRPLRDDEVLPVAQHRVVLPQPESRDSDDEAQKEVSEHWFHGRRHHTSLWSLPLPHADKEEEEEEKAWQR